MKIVDWLEQRRNRFGLLFNMVGNGERNTMNNFGVAERIYFFAPKGWFYQNKIAIAQVGQQWNLPLVDATNQIVSPKMAQHDEATLESWLRKMPFNFFARLLEAGFGKYAERTAYGQNAANLARVAIALERYRLAHGRYPDSLDALAPQFMEKIPHDIIDGQPLHYRLSDDGQFILYSVGWNETDDGGTVDLENGWHGGHEHRRLGLAVSGQVIFRFSIYDLRAVYGHCARLIEFDCTMSACAKSHSLYFLYCEQTAACTAKLDFQNAPGRSVGLGTSELSAQF